MNYLKEGDLLVFNNTRVIPARLFGKKDSGGMVEILIERTVDENLAWAMVRSNKKMKMRTKINFVNHSYADDFDGMKNSPKTKKPAMKNTERKKIA